MKKYTTIFFDLDDTLIDTYQNSVEALSEIYYEFKIDQCINQTDFTEKYHKINNHLWDLYEHGKIDKESLKKDRFFLTLKDDMDIEEARGLEINNRFMELVSSKVNIITDAIAILEYLKPKYKLNILSNGFKEVQGRKMDGADLSKYFDHVILSDHIGKNKPHPDLFTYALNIAEAKKENCLMIGDNIRTDITGAKNSSIDQVWYNPDHLEDVNNVLPTYTISKLSELKNIL